MCVKRFRYDNLLRYFKFMKSVLKKSDGCLMNKQEKNTY